MVAAFGAVFNFYSGYIKDAPEWMQKSGLKWIYRMFSEPKRLFKKYMGYSESSFYW